MNSVSDWNTDPKRDFNRRSMRFTDKRAAAED